MDAFTILGQLNVAVGGTYQTLYTCPIREEVSYTVGSGTSVVTPSSVVQHVQTTVTSIIVCNRGDADTFSIRLLPLSTTTPAAQHDLFLTTAIGANITIVLALGLVLSAGNTISVTCATTARCSFTAMGIETI